MELYLRKESKTRRISKGIEDLKDHLLQVEKKKETLSYEQIKGIKDIDHC